MSPGQNKRPTGTVPKTKTTRKNTVPQEIVAPTRRDLQQHLNDFFASVQQATKTNANGRASESNCFELPDNLSLPEATRSCWPVRPIPRRTYSHETNPETFVPANGTNTAIGVVIPTTPNLSLTQQQNHINEQLLQQNHAQHTQNLFHLRRNNLTPDFSTRSPSPFLRSADTAPHSMSIPNNLLRSNSIVTSSNSRASTDTGTALMNNLAFDDRLNQIQDYIRITTSLLDSINTEKGAPRPQSVASVHSTIPNTPTYEELQSKLEMSTRNIQQIKEQQNQLLRLQQAAKNNLSEMEQVRAQHRPVSFSNNPNGLPNYENAADVQNDVRTLMSRMSNLTDFIHNQNELADSLDGEEKEDLIEEQIRLQKKLDELKNKKFQMSNFMNELQTMNTSGSNNYNSRNGDANDSGVGPSSALRDAGSECVRDTSTTVTASANVSDVSLPSTSQDDRIEIDEVLGADISAEDDEMLREKISEINAMKNQLKRLQNMMSTIKLIEIKNGDRVPEPVIEEEKPSNTSNAIEQDDDPQRDAPSEEREMAERVRALHSMTNDLRQQAVSLAAERDRLKKVKNEMLHRRDNESGTKNLKPQPATVRANDNEVEVEYEQVVEKSGNNDDERLYTSSGGRDWSTPVRSSTSSTLQSRASILRDIERDSTPSKSALNPNKEATDPGTADILNISVEAGSLQSGSSRGFSLPPPMRNLAAREGPWRKPLQENRTPSNNNYSMNAPFENPMENHSPCCWHSASSCYGTFSSAASQSPHYRCCQPNNEQHFCRPSNDSMMLQQFIQTQQMIINSVSQCNQLLWDQQREINNLNNVVLHLQERLLNPSSPNSNLTEPTVGNLNRAESVPPSIVVPNSTNFVPRAQSEQPNFLPYSPQMISSPFRPYSGANNCQQPFYRNTSIGTASPIRMSRQNSLQGSRSSAAPASYYDADQSSSSYGNNYASNPNNGDASNVLLNNDPNSPLPNNTSMHCQPTAQRFIYHNNNTAATNNANIARQSINNSNRLFGQSLPSQAPALNNQVAPGNRANNYWDNFRSYSRQNLLSGGNCKSNEDVFSSSWPNSRSDRIHQSHLTFPNVDITHNNLPTASNTKHPLRNQINQQQQHQNAPDVLNMSSDRHYQQHLLDVSNNSHFNNLNVATSSGIEATSQDIPSNSDAASSTNQFNSIDSEATSSLTTLHTVVNNISSFNFDLNELKQPKTTTKSISKSGKSRCRGVSTTTNDRNLTTASSTSVDHKSSGKSFDDLKENVYLEVSALIAANESRPHFLINLFRELQLISTSDPLRKRLMEAFKDLYLQYGDSLTPFLPAFSSNAQNDDESLPFNPITTSEIHQTDRMDFITPEATNDFPIESQNAGDRLLQSIMSHIRDCTAQGSQLDEISESTLQRVANIIICHLNSFENHQITLDEIFKNLLRFNLRNTKKFIEQIQNYLIFLLLPYQSKSTVANDLISHEHRTGNSEMPTQKMEQNENGACFVSNVSSTINQMINNNSSSKASQSTSIVRSTTQTSISDNQADLAEADQVRVENIAAVNETSQTEPNGMLLDVMPSENYRINGAMENSTIPSCVEEIVDDFGAVGGIISSSSQLPDLAKVSTASSRTVPLDNDTRNESENRNSETFDMQDDRRYLNGNDENCYENESDANESWFNQKQN